MDMPIPSEYPDILYSQKPSQDVVKCSHDHALAKPKLLLTDI
jgi:hypothetical protein